MKTNEPAAIASMATANRYLAELIPTVGFRGAVKRVQQKSNSSIAGELERLERYVEGDPTAEAPAEFSIYGSFMRYLPDKTRAGTGIASINRSMRDARRFADSVRVGLPGDLYYSATLLMVAAVISTMWLLFIAPGFSEMFESFGAKLPSFTRMITTAPWLLFVLIAALAIVLVLLVIGTRRLAAAIDTMAPLRPSWLKLVCGADVVRTHERWRVATMANGWASAGEEPLKALRDAIDRMSASADQVNELTADVQLAHEIGLAGHELDHQCQKSLGEYRNAMESRRALVSRIMQVAIAVLVGGIVIAIYLPLFRIGSLI